MSKRFLKYETENPVGVDNEGCLEPISWDNLADKPFGESPIEIDIIPESKITVELSDDSCFADLEEILGNYGEDLEPVIGQKYYLSIDGDILIGEGTVGSGPIPENRITFNDGSYILTGVFDNIDTKYTGERTIRLYTTAETITPLDPKYIVLTSPNGTKYNLSVSDDGALSATAIS